VIEARTFVAAWISADGKRREKVAKLAARFNTSERTIYRHLGKYEDLEVRGEEEHVPLDERVGKLLASQHNIIEQQQDAIRELLLVLDHTDRKMARLQACVQGLEGLGLVDRRTQIHKLAGSGYSMKDIGVMLGLDPSNVHKVLGKGADKKTCKCGKPAGLSDTCKSCRYRESRCAHVEQRSRTLLVDAASAQARPFEGRGETDVP
jgi:DNA-binding CsgD family transcriptional regulator